MIGRLYQHLKNVYHYFQAHAWRIFYGKPDKGIRIYGVTGTSGKTTTCILLDSILSAEYGRAKVGLMSTEVFRIGETNLPNETHMTSTDAKVVYRFLRQMADAGVEHVVLEMTSHALDQDRLAGISLTGAIITNITREHLDYHKTMEEYMRAKGKIAHYVEVKGTLVLNISDDWTERLARELRMKNYALRMVNFTSEEAKNVETPLLGDFNKENVLAAMKLASAIGVSEEAIAKGVAAIKQVPGRLEWLDTPWGARVVIDFAQTPNEYERLYKELAALRQAQGKGKLIAVFGAAGKRDRQKRPIIAKAVAQYADEIVITQDEPYDDPEEEIYSELEAGLDPECKIGPAFAEASPSAKATEDRSAGTLKKKTAARCKVVWQRIEDRREAMKYAIERTQAGDVVAVTGMGNYTTRAVGKEKIPWSDREVALELIGEFSKSK